MTTEEKVSKETSQEEKFFGVTTSIDDMRPKKKGKDEADEEPITIETDDNDKEAGASADDLDNYSEKVQKRIDHLTWQAKEAERQKSAAEAVREEAVRYAQSVNQQNQNQARIIADGEATLVQQIKSRAEMSVKSARAEYKDAFEKGDTEASLRAQEGLTLALAEQLEAFRYGNDYNQRVQQWTEYQKQQQAQDYQKRQQAYLQQQQRPQQQRQVPKPTPESQSWAQRNPWFGKNEHIDMTAIAYATHERIVRNEGVKPDSDEYYQKIDAEMHKRFPEYFKSNKSHRPSTVVAPSTRNNGGQPRTVKLNAHQLSLIKSLGISREKYAEQILKGERNG